MKDKEVRIGYQIRRLDNGIKKRVDKQLRAEGIDESTLMHGWILKYLYDNRERQVYQKDIEKHFNIGRSTVTGIIKMMEKDGYIRREAVENDARLKRVILLPKGEEIHHMIGCAVKETDFALMEMLTPEELETFLGILTKINNNLEKER